MITPKGTGGEISSFVNSLCPHSLQRALGGSILEDNFTEDRLEALSHNGMPGEKKTEQINKCTVARTQSCLLKNSRSFSKKATLNVGIC